MGYKEDDYFEEYSQKEEDNRKMHKNGVQIPHYSAKFHLLLNLPEGM
jgi:hypothetical protein